MYNKIQLEKIGIYKRQCPHCSTKMHEGSFVEVVKYEVNIIEEKGKIIRDSVLAPIEEPYKGKDRYTCLTCGEDFEEFKFYKDYITEEPYQKCALCEKLINKNQKFLDKSKYMHWNCYIKMKEKYTKIRK